MLSPGYGVGGYGISSTSDRFGQGVTNFDAGAAIQQKLAVEQWDWEKQKYADELKQSKAAGTSLSKLINQYNQGWAEAKAANEARYQQGLGIIDQTTGQREADIRSDCAGQRSDIMQQLARTGMGNTTISPTLGLGVEREKQSALNRLADSLQGTKLGWIERREDEYPESDMIVSLINQLGKGSGGQSGSQVYSALGNMRIA